MTPTATIDPETETPSADQSQPVADYGVKNRNLPDQIVKAILAAFKDAQGQEEYIRRQEILQDSEHRLYDLGIQHIYQNRSYCWTQASPGGTFSGVNGDQESFGNYIGDYNIFTAYGLIIQAKISEPEIGIDFQAIRPDFSDDRESATAAEGIRHQYDIDNNTKEIVQQIVYHVEMGGRAVTWTRTEDEIAPFGVNPNGTPRRKIVSTVGGCLEWKVPVFANDRADCWYAINYDDPDIKNAKTKYPWIAKNLGAGDLCLGENTYERIARLGVIQSSQTRGQNNWNVGDSMSHLISRGNVWLRLSAFESASEGFIGPDGQQEPVQEEDGSVRAKTVKEKIADIFPDGVHAVIVGKEYAESWNESIDDCLSITHAYIGKGQSRKPLMKEMVLVQDGFNQTVNYIRESNDFGVPSTWLNSDFCDYPAIQKQKAQPGAFREMKGLPPTAKMSDMVYREDERGVPANFMQFMEFLQNGLPQFQLACPPSVWGAAMADQKLMDVNEPVPTPSGFVRNGDLVDGSLVLGEDGNIHKVVKAHPVQTMEAYRVAFDDGTSVCVHAGHLWGTFTRDERIQRHRRSARYRARQRELHKRTGTGLYPQQVKRNENRGGDNYTPKPVTAKVRTTEEIAATLLVGSESSKMGVCVNHTIPLCLPINLPERKLPIDPYCLGAWLGDGTSSGGGFTATDEDGPQILRFFREAGYSFKRNKGPNAWHVAGLTTDLHAIGVRDNKHIPEEYLFASAGQRLALLQGLMDTDGSCSDRGRAVFSNANRSISEGVYHLAASLGLKPFIFTHDVKLNGVECSPAHRVEWAGDVPVFRMKRKLVKLKKSYSAMQKWRYITSVTPCGPMEMRCLTTDNPSGLYLFGRNFNVTHNTSSGYALAASQAMGILGKLRTRVVWSVSEIYYHACLAVSRDEKYADEITVPVVKGRTAIVRKDSLKKGNFRAFPDKNSGFPESTQQIRSSLERTVGMLAPTPLGMQVFGSPANAAEMIRVSGLNLVIPEAVSWEKQSREIESLLRQPPKLMLPELVQNLNEGAGVQAMIDAIKAAVAKAQADAMSAMMVEHAAQSIAAEAQGQAPPPMPPPPQIDRTTIAKSSVAVRDSDFHLYEANKCRDWLSSDDCAAEESVGRPSPNPEDNGALKPNISGILNVSLHRLEHLDKEALEPSPVTGPLPAVGSAPKVSPVPVGA